jgi:hypothetical protein
MESGNPCKFTHPTNFSEIFVKKKRKSGFDVVYLIAKAVNPLLFV